MKWIILKNPMELKTTKMVFIGRKLPQEIFTKGLEQCLAK